MQFNDKDVNCNKTLALHLHNRCQENILVHKKVNSNSCIENVSWAIVIIHVKSKVFCTIVKVNNPILGDCGKSVIHHITKLITLVIDCGITIYYKSISLTNIYNYYKISNKDILSLAKQDQAIDCLQKWQQTKYDENDKQKMTKTLPNVPWWYPMSLNIFLCCSTPSMLLDVPNMFFMFSNYCLNT